MLSDIFLLSCLAVLGSANDVVPSKMIAVPIERSSWAATTDIKIAYRHQMPSSGSEFSSTSVIVANVNLTTTRPTINLDNFVQIKGVSCFGTRMEILFDSADSASSAFDEWSTTNNLAMLVGHEWECFGFDMAALNVSNMAQTFLGMGHRLKMAATKVPLKSVIKDYEVEIVKSEEKSKTSHTYIFPLSANYENGMAKNPRMDILTTSDIDVDCINCYTVGSADLHLRFRGSFFGIQSYGLKIDGSVKANLDFIATSSGIPTIPKVYDTITLAKTEFHSVEIPGFFNFTPALVMNAGVAVWSDKRFSLQTGFDVYYPFNVEIGAKSMFKPPNATYDSNPTFTPHAPILDGNVHVTPHLVPKIDLFVAILGYTLDLGVNVDNALDVEVFLNLIQVDVGNFTMCPEEKVNVKLFNRHTLNFAMDTPVAKRYWTLFDSGVHSLACAFCDKCPLLLD